MLLLLLILLLLLLFLLLLLLLLLLWSQSADHKKDAKWFQDLLSEVNVRKQEKIDITTGSLKQILGRMPN